MLTPPAAHPMQKTVWSYDCSFARRQEVQFAALLIFLCFASSFMQRFDHLWICQRNGIGQIDEFISTEAPF